MALSVGIVGLPNVGKSTLFNALVRGHQAKVADYPFTTIEPNVGIVEVPDERLSKVASRLSLEKQIPATIKFIDIAGLVKNAHQGEGLGNQFLSHIREVDAIIHVLDGFSKETDPQEAMETVNIELELAGIKKPTIYVLNVREKDVQKAELGSSKWVASATERSASDASVKRPSLSDKLGREMTITICAKLEAELTELSDQEQKEYLVSLGLKESGLIRLIQTSYQLLNLITFYTLKFDKQPGSPLRQDFGGLTQAWPIMRGTLAPEAAAKIHTDMARGFICAEVCHFDDLVSAGSWQAAHQKGKIRTEGKTYQIHDGDVVLFKFNV